MLHDNDGHAADDGYHDLDPYGRPYAMVFLDPILKHHGTWLRTSNSVSATVSHEACEFVVDPATNRWAQHANNSMWSLEVCDPVQAFSYQVRLRNELDASVSDFVCPAWFNPWAQRSDRVDWMRKLHWPFEIAPNGYATRFSGGRSRTIWGPDYPAWRKRTERVCGSRTWRRHTYGGSCRDLTPLATTVGNEGRRPSQYRSRSTLLCVVKVLAGCAGRPVMGQWGTLL